MTVLDMMAGTFCIVGKCRKNEKPHIISCAIGMQTLVGATGYATNLALMRDQVDKRRKQYEWCKAMPLDEALADKDIVLHPADKAKLDAEYVDQGERL